MTEPEFSHFSQDLFDFLADLSEHNEREWFNANKARYEASVRAPALDFIRALGPRIQAISPHFLAIDKKVGGSLMRPYRDTRFSKDKTPFKTNLGIQLRHDGGKDVHAPGVYFHVDASGVFLGVGSWHPEPAALKSYRDAIAEDPERWTAVTRDPAFAESFELRGESLKRPPRGYDKDHPQIADIMRKDFIAVHNVAADDILQPGLPDRVASWVQVAAPYLRFLCEAQGAAF
ncbi:MAG: DUF2461 domain-containing protein [Alphaproteobacteria bacterium]|nr:DUF2461 domain-containing protein [Alphaproteobacteria bacterium]